jgi:hypothetical protein
VRYILTFSIALEIFAHHQQRIHFSSEKRRFFISYEFLAKSKSRESMVHAFHLNRNWRLPKKVIPQIAQTSSTVQFLTEHINLK